MRAHTRFVHDHECAIKNVQMALLDKKDGKPFLDSYGLKRRK
jgi:hypothetical protein